MYDLTYIDNGNGVPEITALYKTLIPQEVYTMRSQDWADQESVRNLAVSQLAEVCAAMGLSWSATEKAFIIDLPDVLLTPLTHEPVARRKSFDISTWGPVGPVEGIPDDIQFPDYGEILDEGEPPKGDPKAEK